MSHEIRILEDSHNIWERLSHTPQPPRVLRVRGSLAPPGHRLVAIVGSRRCSQYAREVTAEICAALAGHPVSIVSGLAYGIDAHAHACALEHGLHTVAVLGGGIADSAIYPQAHFRLAMRILDSGGALITEQEPDAPSLPWMFPARNRIMAGLADLVIVVEAREKSGSLITARLATDYNRDLMAVPNSIYATGSKGTNELIRQGAYAYTKPRDVVELLGFEYLEPNPSATYRPSAAEQLVLNAIMAGHAHMERIVDYCLPTATAAEISQALLSLEIENVIRRSDGAYAVLKSC